MTAYATLLKDPRWQRRRLEILQRNDFACEYCSATDKTLHVHHRIYRKGAKPWAYEDHELVALCEDCHKAEHELHDRLSRALTILDLDRLSRIVGYAEAVAVGFSAGEAIELLDDAHAVGVGAFFGLRRQEIAKLARSGTVHIDDVVERLQL